MTSKDWEKVEKCLMNFWPPVKLKCDGYDLTLQLEQISQFKNAIKIYVNGWFKGEWLLNDCEERRRFCRPVKKSVHSQKHKAALKKIPKTTRQKMGLPDIDAKHTYYLPYWTSFKALKRHLINNNNEIKLIVDSR